MKHNNKKISLVTIYISINCLNKTQIMDPKVGFSRF